MGYSQVSTSEGIYPSVFGQSHSTVSRITRQWTALQCAEVQQMLVYTRPPTPTCVSFAQLDLGIEVEEMDCLDENMVDTSMSSSSIRMDDVGTAREAQFVPQNVVLIGGQHGIHVVTHSADSTINVDTVVTTTAWHPCDLVTSRSNRPCKTSTFSSDDDVKPWMIPTSVVIKGTIFDSMGYSRPNGMDFPQSHVPPNTVVSDDSRTHDPPHRYTSRNPAYQGPSVRRKGSYEQ
ncbi:unnamed protein product [Notodromas monacha]|uniref:Uncharacterized protein n=1 Tax=Notodromas monacha TaxID=399045 RepID=A0A7R9BCD8_9CRUS|nr:unnamed protein product [Notodromas monacha]CAG0912283.1 unnamed protein product [Notodromas monacha]